MSGGSLDYAYRKVDDIADAISAQAQTPLQKTLASHLRKVSKALHDLEWVWSSDKSPGDEDAAIRAVVLPAEIVETALADAEAALLSLQAEIKQFRDWIPGP